MRTHDAGQYISKYDPGQYISKYDPVYGISKYDPVYSMPTYDLVVGIIDQISILRTLEIWVPIEREWSIVTQRSRIYNI